MTDRTIHIGAAGGLRFVLPIDVVTQKLSFLGRTGSGKSYAATKAAEGMLDAGAQVVVIDPVGIWWGLRLKKDGTTPAYRIPVFGGLHGDIPIQPTSGAIIADLVVDRHLSVILDVSQFESDKDKARFAEAFVSRFFFRKKAAPSPVHVFLEECQEFVPQNTQKGEEHMLHAFNRMWKLGRNFGIGGSLISQRPQEVNKKALNMTGCMFAFQMAAPQERKTVKDWASYSGGTVDIDKVLPTLSVGTAHVDSPQWLGFSGIVEVAEKKTFDSSSTPEVGAAKVKFRELEPADLEQLRTDLAATIVEAEASDPAKLKKRIRELEHELLNASGKVRPPVDIDRLVLVAVATATAPLNTEIVDLKDRMTKVASNVGSAIGCLEVAAKQFDLNGHASTDVPVPEQAPGGWNNSGIKTGRKDTAKLNISKPDVRDSESPVSAPERPGAPGVTTPQQRILDALAAYESFGQRQVDRTAVAAFAGYKPGSGHVNNVIGSLVTAGLVHYPQPSFLALTQAGRSYAYSEPIRTLHDVHDRWYAICSTPQRKLLEALIEVYPDDLSREELADRTGYTAGTGHFNNIVGSLSTLGAAEYPRKGHVRASELLFPEIRYAR